MREEARLDERGAVRGLCRDRGGAVVIIGVFVALALTGSLWFLIGIGDAIAFRETAQEATDAATFSSAVVHARSMNFIAAINLVMVGVTAVYLVLAIIADLFSVALLTCTTIAVKPCSYGTYGAVPAALEIAQESAQQAADAYEDGLLRTTIKAGDQLQKVIAKAAPWTGSVAGGRVAKRYEGGFVASTLGLSNAPNIDGRRGATIGNEPSGARSEERLGLPLVTRKAATLCDRVFAMSKLGTRVQRDSNHDFAKGFAALDRAVTEAARSAGTGRYCKSGIFSEDGPKVVASDAQNGSDYMQVYGFMLKAEFVDQNRAERAVGSLARTKRSAATKDVRPRSNVYMSQAEFFFDCASTWESSACNEDDAAAFSPRWMVRLRRMRAPVAGAALAGQAMSLLTTGAGALTGSSLGVPGVGSQVQGALDAANGEVGSVLSAQMSAFFTAPPIDLASSPTGVPKLPNVKGVAQGALESTTANLPVPGYFH